MAKPDFFIVGAPKCGTTAMDRYLRQHPDIFMAKKEIHYFGADLAYTEKAKVHPQTEAEYLAYFTDWNGEKRIGESSVYYFVSRHAPTEIKAFQPDAQIIILLRNPLEMLYSHYYSQRANLNEDAPTFEAALDAEPARREGRQLPEHMYLPNGLMYSDNGAFSQHVERYFETFGRERVHIILYDDLKADTQQVYRALLTFLNVDPDFTVDFETVNANKVLRNRRLQALINQSPAPIKAVKQLIPERVRTTIGGYIRRLNTVETKRPPLKPETRDRLRTLFKDDVQRLSEMLGRDLTHWVMD